MHLADTLEEAEEVALSICPQEKYDIERIGLMFKQIEKALLT